MKEIFKSFISLLRILKYCITPIRFSKQTLSDSIFILGNGPSLNDFIQQITTNTKNNGEFFAVNEFCLSDAFEQIKPKYYFLADPAYLNNTNLSNSFKEIQSKIISTLQNKVNWKMSIFIPKNSENIKIWLELSNFNKFVEIIIVNTNLVEGNKFINHYFFKKNMGMPLLQNVMIGSIFISINLGYKKIYLHGVDHSLHEGLMVDKNNKLCIKTNHFNKQQIKPYYKDAREKELFKVHEFFFAWANTFKEYYTINDYASSLSVEVYNLTKNSYIDAFQKIELEEIK